MSLSEYSLSGKKFWPRWYTKKSTWYVVKFRAQKLAIVFQNKSFFNLVKDFFKWIECLERSFTVRVQSEGERVLTYVVYEKSTWYVVKFRAQKLAIMFQHKSLFNLDKDIFKWIEGLGRSVTVRVQSEWEKVFDLGGIRKKYLIRCQISRSKTRYSVSKKIAFQPSQGLIQMNWMFREEFHCPSTVWGGKSFWSMWYTKKVLDTLSNFAPKNSL